MPTARTLVLTRINSLRKLIVYSSVFQLTDAVGIPLPKTGATSIPVIVKLGQQPAPIVLKVTGVAH